MVDKVVAVVVAVDVLIAIADGVDVEDLVVAAVAVAVDEGVGVGGVVEPYNSEGYTTTCTNTLAFTIDTDDGCTSPGPCANPPPGVSPGPDANPGSSPGPCASPDPNPDPDPRIFTLLLALTNSGIETMCRYFNTRIYSVFPRGRVSIGQWMSEDEDEEWDDDDDVDGVDDDDDDGDDETDGGIDTPGTPVLITVTGCCLLISLFGYRDVKAKAPPGSVNVSTAEEIVAAAAAVATAALVLDAAAAALDGAVSGGETRRPTDPCTII